MLVIMILSLMATAFIAGGISCVAFATWLEEKHSTSIEVTVTKSANVPTFKPDILYYKD